MRSSPSKPRPLFIAGPPRSGTTALCDYLNEHPEILVCRERYKYVSPRAIRPDLFRFERILDFRPGETNVSRDLHVELLARKDPARLRWVGDKYPHWIKRLRVLAARNRGARFLVMYRSVEEVAMSFEARARNPRDSWPEQNGAEAAVSLWNEAMLATRQFAQHTRWRRRILVVDYGFFADPAPWVQVLADFLDVEVDEALVESWASMSDAFSRRAREKPQLTAEQREALERGKDRDSEQWVLELIERQAAKATSGWKWPRLPRPRLG